MSIKYILLITLFLGAQIGYSQSTIQGKVLNEKQESLTGATVLLVSDNDGAISSFSDSNGDFSIQVDNYGDYTLTIKYLGQNTYTRNISIESNETINLQSIVLDQASESLQSVEVIGRKQ